VKKGMELGCDGKIGSEGGAEEALGVSVRQCALARFWELSHLQRQVVRRYR
jgi:hypothetical protein